MVITPHNLVRHELCGLYVKIVRSTNPTQVGLKGRIVSESYHMLTLETGKGEKRVAKKDCVFVFKLPSGLEVRVDGKVLVGRPEDRIKKKLARW